MAWRSLGRDFWLFRIGQIASLIGDNCSKIALAWWILDKTGSAALMSSVLAPAELFQTIFIPLFGPFGDRFARKKLVVWSDVWRAILTLIIVSMVFSDFFALPAVITLYVLLSVGSALFFSVSSSIIPQLVKPEDVPEAIQQTEAINAFGRILGGIIGGVIVTAVGVGGAFVIDAVSFILSAITASMIVATTLPDLSNRERKNSIKTWAHETTIGFTMLRKLPVLFWLVIVCMAFNFVISPIAVALPVLVKEGRGLPPWFLGGLNSSISLGVIVGSFSINTISKKLFSDHVMILGFALTGIGVAFMPWAPTIALPLVMMFLIGFGATLVNVPLNSKLALAIPDHVRSRLMSVLMFMSSLAKPLGIAFAGSLISLLGLNYSLSGMGSLIFIMSPLVLLIPLFSKLFRSDASSAKSFLADHYPQVKL